MVLGMMDGWAGIQGSVTLTVPRLVRIMAELALDLLGREQA